MKADTMKAENRLSLDSGMSRGYPTARFLHFAIRILEAASDDSN
jgi:hypothetical protein